jgi:tetratricopeptide (TPR) repeat protein
MKALRFISIVCLLLVPAFAVAQNNTALERAGALASAGQTDQAIQAYRDVLQQEPQNVEALSALSNLFEAKGRWREAVPLLEKLVELQPHDSAALYRLGRMKSWQSSEQNNEASQLLKRACDTSDHNPEYCTAYADLLSWKQETRAEAVSRLRETLAAHPDAVETRLKLAQILSWNDVTRPEALNLFDEGLQLDAKNKELLLASADVLSWRSSTWSQAISRYDRVLQQDPSNVNALNGKAQLFVWHNRSAEAMTLYEQVLVTDPKNPVALRGKAEIMNRRGLFVEARSLAEQAHAGAPTDERTNLELARADIGLLKFREARDLLNAVTGAPAPDFLEARQEVRRGLGTYMEFGYGLRKAHHNGDFNRFDAAISTPLGTSSRITFLYEPTLYETPQQNFNSSYFEAGITTQVSERVTTSFRGGAEVFQNVPVAANGGFNLSYKPISSTTVKVGFERAPVVESLLSIRGVEAGNDVFGQVRSNLADIGISYYNSNHKFDSYVDYSDGVYTGLNLDPNRRYGVDAGFGKSVRGDAPYIRLGYGISYLSFDHDADLQDGQPITRFTGGYFSPTTYLLNQAVLTFAHSFSKNLEWGANGTAGVQNFETSTQSFSTSQFASSFETHLFWRVSPMNELRLNYQYLNTFNSFERNLYRLQWRHYF